MIVLVVPVIVKKPSFSLIFLSILAVKKLFDYQNVAIDHTKMFPKGQWLKIIIGNDRRIFMPKFCPSPLSKSQTLSRILVHSYIGIQVDKKKHNTQLNIDTTMAAEIDAPNQYGVVDAYRVDGPSK